MKFRSRIYTLMFTTSLLILCVLTGGWLTMNHLLNESSKSYENSLTLTNTVDLARTSQISFQRQVQEWKNVLLRSHDQSLRDKHLKAFDEREKDMARQLTELHGALMKLNFEDHANTVANIIKEHQVLGQKYRESLATQSTLDSYESQKSIDTMVRGIDRQTSSGMDALIVALETDISKRFDDDFKEAKLQALQLIGIIATTALIGAFFIILFLWKLFQKTYESIGVDPAEAVKISTRMASGDFGEDLSKKAKKTDSLIGQLSMLQYKLRNIVVAIQEVANDIEKRAQEIPESVGKNGLRTDVSKMREAINRISLKRDNE